MTAMMAGITKYQKQKGKVNVSIWFGGEMGCSFEKSTLK